MHLRVDEGRCIIAFEGEGCALALASASALCEAGNGMDEATLEALVSTYDAALAGSDSDTSLGGDLPHLLAVRSVPSRLGCVRLAPTALLDGLRRIAKPPC